MSASLLQVATCPSGGGERTVTFFIASGQCVLQKVLIKNNFYQPRATMNRWVDKRTDLFLTALEHRILHLQYKILYVYILYNLIANNIISIMV